MVKIVNYQKRQNEAGKVFFVLELQSGVELVLSQQTGQYYATAKKAYITSTFDDETCKALVGTEMQGSIEKISTEPYQYTIKETGEITILNHKYVFVPEGQNVSREDTAIQKLLSDENAFSKNGKHEGEFAL